MEHYTSPNYGNHGSQVFTKRTGQLIQISRRYFVSRVKRIFSRPKSVFWTAFLLLLIGATILFLYNTIFDFRLYRTHGPMVFDENEPACKLPTLDPWHKSVLEYTKDLKPLKCEGRAHSRLQDGKLTLQEGVTDVTVEEISRVPGDDSQIKYKKINILMKEKQNQTRRFIYEGFKGNMQHYNKKCFHPYGGLENPDNNTKVVLHPDCGFKRIDFKIVKKESGIIIQHEPSGKCLQPEQNSTKNTRNIVLSTNCKASFRMLKNGRLQHIASGFCIQARNDANKNRREDDVILKDDCKHQDSVLYGINGKGTKTIALNSEFVRVKGKVNDEDFEEFHLQVIPNPHVLKRPIKPEGLGLNVFMIMFDSTSAANFHRKMRKTTKYLQQSVDTVFFQGEGIVGDGTTAQMSAMLTGIAEEEQEEARRGKPGAKSVDDWRWIYRNFKDLGYATLLSEDQASVATFNLRLIGFKKPPTDHYARPFWIAVDEKMSSMGTSKSDYCLDSQVIHNSSLEYVKSFVKAYPQRPKFSLGIFSYLSHENLNTLSYADDDVIRFLEFLRSTNTLNSSMVIIFGDHGFRMGGYRETTQGKLEERLPFLSITLPAWFSGKHADLYNNLKQNSKILTSPFDVYATLRHVVSYPNQPRVDVTGQSLFNLIDRKKRTCQDAGIDSHWCPCMQWEKVDSDHEIIKTISNSVMNYINNMTSSTDFLRQSCQPFTLRKVQEAWKEAPNMKVQTFKNTKRIAKCDSCVAVFGQKTSDTLARDTQYQIQLIAEPGPAVFEASVRTIKGHAQISSNFISRINKYGDQPYCIRNTHTHLMKYCYCKHQRTR